MTLRRIRRHEASMKRAAIVSPIRTPVGKFLGALASIPAGELARGDHQSRWSSARGSIQSAIDEVIFAQGYGNGEAPCIARWAALAAGLPISVPGYQLDRRCGSGLQAVIDAAMMVQTGAADVVIAGGVESMSNAEYYTTDMRGGRARRLGDPARPPGARPRDEPAGRALRRDQRHDRDRRQPGPRLPDQPARPATSTPP